MTKRIIVATLGVALCAGGCAFWHVYGAQSMTQPQAPAPAVAVVAERLQASDVPIVMTGIGTVVAYNVVDVHAQVTGTIDQIGFVAAPAPTRRSLRPRRCSKASTRGAEDYGMCEQRLIGQSNLSTKFKFVGG